MARNAWLFGFVVVAACSSADDLPLGGPYGGIMAIGGDASVAADAGLFIVPPGIDAGLGTDTGVVVVPGTGTGTGFSSGTGTGVIGTGTGTGVGVGPGSGTGTGTGLGTGTGTGTGMGTGTGVGSTAPTWTYLYQTYLAAGSTPGDCDGSCHHHSECSSPSSCYSWLGRGSRGALSDSSGGGLFSWDSNGWMPPSGPSSEPQADKDFDAWIAAGSLDN